eukprot:1188327-Prorocentrum_minimum.AAC.3
MTSSRTCRTTGRTRVRHHGLQPVSEAQSHTGHSRGDGHRAAGTLIRPTAPAALCRTAPLLYHHCTVPAAVLQLHRDCCNCTTTALRRYCGGTATAPRLRRDCAATAPRPR